MGAVLVDVGVVLTVGLIPRVVLELDIVLLNADVVAELEALKHRITRVAIWGLLGDSYDSPFDMIDAPPSYVANVKGSATKKDKTG
ncbi:hypothetical protein N7471_000986 [Penicillium samsonianum]|uniref:uncharacterized protein n=1 Tax=Penicillium samsonianum TaxID=1882272 RepID=UPI002548744F|nr:uncharacterized protein N7471_000986 [Penicillium samsonianum]KAJ6149787.1 hypothetical protein N7471_000986 [Penicillium samsonianum]